MAEHLSVDPNCVLINYSALLSRATSALCSDMCPNEYLIKLFLFTFVFFSGPMLQCINYETQTFPCKKYIPNNKKKHDVVSLILKNFYIYIAFHVDKNMILFLIPITKIKRSE